MIGLGRNPVIPKDLEKMIANYATYMDDLGFGITKKNIKAIANMTAKRLGHKGFRGNGSWFKRFMKRNPELAIRKAQSFEQLRAFGLDRDQTERFFNIVRDRTQECLEQSESKPEEMNPDFVLNIDESGINIDADSKMILSSKGKKRVHKVSNYRTVPTRATSVNTISAEELW
jgi:hypothetical protein